MKKKLKIKKYDWGGLWNNSTTPAYTNAPTVTGQRTEASYLPTNRLGDNSSTAPNSYSWGTQASSGAPSTISAFGQTQGTGDYLNSSLSGVASSMGTIVGYNPDATKATGYNKDVRNFNKFQKASTSTGTKVGRGIGIAALNFIPFVGPLIAGIGAPAVDAMVEGRRKQLREKAERSLNAQQDVENANSQELTLNPQMAHGGSYTGGPVQLEKDETLLRQLPNGGTIVERFNLPTHEQSGDIPNTYMNKPDYAATPNFGYNKYGQITLNPKEVKMTFADKTKKIESRFKRNHADPIANKTKEMALNQVKQDNELLKSALEQAQTSKMMYGGKIPKAANGLKWSDLGMQDKIAYARSKQALNSKADDFAYMEGINRGDFDSMFQDIDFTDIFGPITSKSATLINSKPINNILNNNTYNTSKVTPTKVVDSPTVNNSKLGLTAGDYTQLAGTLPALGYNLARAFEKPEVERFGRDLTPIREQVLAKDYNPIIMAQNAGMATLNDSTNASSRNANLISLISNVAGEKAKYNLATDVQNAGLARQRDQLLSGQRQANIEIGIQEKDTNARNRAAQRGFGAKAASQFGQSITEVGKSMNTNKTNNVKYNSLNSLTGSYTVNPDGSITFKKRKGGYYK